MSMIMEGVGSFREPGVVLFDGRGRIEMVVVGAANMGELTFWVVSGAVACNGIGFAKTGL